MKTKPTNLLNSTDRVVFARVVGVIYTPLALMLAAASVLALG